MTELPPDPPRLRAILADLEERLADHETVGIYLRLQREEVQRALTAAERPAPSSRQLPRAQRPALEAPARGRQTGYVIDRHPGVDGPQPRGVHLDDCKQPSHLAQAATAEAARAAIVGGLEACPLCRPDTKLGILD